MSWFSGFENLVRVDVPLRDFTWYRLGGCARWFCQPHDETELATLFVRMCEAGIPWRVLGGGANVIVRETGFDGVVIHLSGPVFERVEFEDQTVHVGAGADLPKLIRTTIKNGLVGLEILAGIPATIGGALRMNAGGRYGEIGQLVREVRLVEPDGRLVTHAARELGFTYRGSNLCGRIAVSAVLTLQYGDADAALARHREIWNAKYETQPPLSARSSGCVFKNPAERAAGRLLDEAGLKGMRIGGAEISTRHANFIVAHDGATADDVLNLIEYARQRVRENTGIELEPEVEVW